MNSEETFIANNLNPESDPAKINTAAVERKKLLDELRDIDVIGFGTLNPGNKSDLILKQTLTTRENLLKDWQAAFSKPNYDDAKGKSSADVKDELDERVRLNAKAKDLFTPAMLATIGSTMSNDAWKQEIADRGRLISDFKDIGGARNDNYKGKSSQDLKQLYDKRKKAVDELSKLYASTTQQELVGAISTSTISDLIQKKNAREEILLKLAQAYNNSTPAKVIDKDLNTGDLNLDLANRLQEYKETVESIEKLSGAGAAGQTDAQSNNPPLSTLRRSGSSIRQAQTIGSGLQITQRPGFGFRCYLERIHKRGCRSVCQGRTRPVKGETRRSKLYKSLSRSKSLMRPMLSKRELVVLRNWMMSN